MLAGISKQFQDGLSSMAYLNLLEAVVKCSLGNQLKTLCLQVKTALEDAFDFEDISRWCQLCATVFQSDAQKPMVMRSCAVTMGKSSDDALYAMLLE